MLGPRDLQQIAKVVDPKNESEFLNQYTVPDVADYNVEHLDYAYVETCKDVSELSMLLKVLKSGKEGFYPALEEAILVRIETLCPQLKRIVPLSAVESATISLNIDAELREWVSSISVKDAELARKKTCPDAKTTLNDDFLDPMNEQGLSNAIQVSEYTRILPAIRGTMSASSKTGDIVATCQKNDTRLKVPNENLKPLMSTSKNPSRIKSSDYRAWEKFNIEEALEKVDLPHPLPSAPKLIRPTAKLTPPPIQPSQPTQLSPILAQDEEVKQYQAVMEKYKGNECFKTNDFSEALKFYNRSLDLHPTPQVLTNRAATYLKLCDYESAEIDATRKHSTTFIYSWYIFLNR
ncbi:hypothetical protein RTP6_002685 [Batrachochytrium dendrobatidis]